MQEELRRREEIEPLEEELQRRKEKTEQRRLKKQQQEETDEVYDLSNLFKNQTRYTDEHFMDVINEVMSLLDRGLVVEISGTLMKSDGSTIEEYNTLFYTKPHLIHIITTYKIQVI